MPELAENVVVAGRFRLIRKLGQGGMGSVWLAQQTALDTQCAIKFIEGDHAHVPEMQARFEREAKAAAALRSPHVVQIIDHAIWEGTPFIAMELLDGEDLGKRLDKQGRLPPAQVVHVLGQVCRALTKAHQLGIVHRDLKPDNIYLVRDDDREITKVLDFGIAKSSKTGMESASNTKTGAMLGTPYYMSPEQAQGTKTVDFRSDLWSMAVIAFQCVTGRLPFESEALGDLLMKIMVSELPVPSRVAPDVPPSFDAWWARASARDPAARFQSSKEFIDALALSLGVAGDGTGTFKADPRAAPGSGGTLPLGAVTPNPYGAVTPNPYGNATPNPTAGQFATPDPAARTLFEEPPKKQGSMVLVIAGATVVLLGAIGVGVFALKSKSTNAAVTPTVSVSVAVTATAPSATASATPLVAVDPPPSATTATTPVATASVAIVHTNGSPTPSSKIGGNKPVPSAKPSASAATTSHTGKPDLGF